MQMSNSESDWKFRVLVLLLCLSPVASLAEFRDADLIYLDSGQWTFNRDCVIRGDTLCTTLAYGAQFWDVSDPAAPTLISDFYTGANQGHVLDWEGDLLGITTENGRLFLVDTSNLLNLTTHAEITGIGSDPDIAFVRDGQVRWAYTAGGSGLQIRDVSDPDNVISHGSISLAGTEVSIAPKGDILLVLASNDGLHSVSVSNPDEPSLLNSISLSGTLKNVHADGHRAVVATNDITQGFYTLDVTDPAAPAVRAQIIPNVGDGAGDLRVIDAYVDGTLVYLATFSTGIVVYDIDDLANPSYVGHDPRTYLTPKDMDFADGRAYVSHWGNTIDGVYIVDLTTPADPSYLGKTRSFDYGRFADEENGWIYVATGDGGITYHEHVSETDLAFRGALTLPNTWGVDADGGLVYVLSTSEGLVIADIISDPDNPEILSTLDLGQTRGAEVHGIYAYVASFSEGLYTVNVSDPENPQVLDNYYIEEIDMKSLNISVQHPLAATSDRYGGMNLWDISDPENIVHLGGYMPGPKVIDVELDGDEAYAVVETQGVHVVDISNTSNPVQIGSSIASNATGCVVENDYLHVSRGGVGVTTYYIEDPSNPALLASFDSNSTALAVHAEGNYVYVSDRSALTTLRYVEDTSVVVFFFDLNSSNSEVTAVWEVDPDLVDPEFSLISAAIDVDGVGEVEVPIDQTGPASYRAVDDRPELGLGGAWRYTLQLRENGGDWVTLRQEEILLDQVTPLSTLALENHPNPFNPQTHLSCELQTAGHVKLEVYDVAGSLVSTLYDGWQEAGLISVPWNGCDHRGDPVGSGVYFGRVVKGGKEAHCKLTLIR